jgi:hypothetical protein
MTDLDIETRIIDWGLGHSEVEAIIQIGSRVQVGVKPDGWSDWDFQLIVRNPNNFLRTDWLDKIAPVWSKHIEHTERGATKLSVVFAGGYEVDFVLLSAWQIKLVYWAMAHPSCRSLYPAKLVKGVLDMRLVVSPGFKIALGGEPWKRRLTALTAKWPGRTVTQEEFQSNAAAFWRHAVWVSKKIMRGEVRAALRWYHKEVAECTLLLLEEEARLAGYPVRPEARKAEAWLSADRLRQTAIETRPDQLTLARALLSEITLFEELSLNVARSRGFALADYSAVAAWLRTELNKLVQPD